LIAVGSGRPFNTAAVKNEPGITREAIEGNRDFAVRLRALAGQAAPPYRYDTADAHYGWSGAGPVLRLPTANGCDPLAPERLIQVRLAFAPGPRWGTCYQVVDPSSPVVGLLNVRYLVSQAPVRSPWFRPAAEVAGYQVFENTRVQPRFFLVDRVRPVRNLKEAAAALRAPDFDPAREAVLEGTPVTGLMPGAAYGSVDVLRYEPAYVRLRTRSTGSVLLVGTDSYYPGWTAAIDGVPTPLRIADAAFRGIVVPGGEHRVEMRFRPAILFWFGAVSLAALAAAAVTFRCADKRAAIRKG
jgi:hypothetical protein